MLKEENLSTWKASLSLRFEKRRNSSVLIHNKHQGPLLVQKPFYPEGKEVCHVYILHPPGGVVQGDQLSIDVNVNHQAHALLTTPAAGKFYRSQGKTASLVQTINVAQDSIVEWLPQETLLFNKSQVELKTIINLSSDARFIAWEMLCLGRKASNDKFIIGSCKQQFEIYRETKALFIERSKIESSDQYQDPLLTENWGLLDHPLSATMLASNCTKLHLNAIQDYFNSLTIDDLLSVTLKGELLICRFLGQQAEQARKYFIQVWKIIRRDIVGHDVCVPRIWNT
jgi:urease accessory protein